MLNEMENLNVENSSSVIHQPLYRRRLKIKHQIPQDPRESLDTYSCKNCPAIFSRSAKLKLHLKTHHEGQKIQKSEKHECSDGLTEAEDITKKDKKKKGFLKNKCEICHSSFRGNARLKMHMRIHNGERPYCCNECDAKFIQSVHLLIHKRMHTGEKPYQCNVCKHAFKQISHLRTHERIHTQIKPYSCEQCSMSFIQKSSLNRHLKIHTGEQPFKCPFCFVKFSIKNNLNRHLKSKHSKISVFNCKECGASFSKLSDKIRHLMAHTGDNVFRCEECESTFHNYMNLEHHLLTHTGEILFECDECSAKFTSQKELDKHHIVHEESVLFSCSFCPKFFSNKISLGKHEKKHTDNEIVSCLICLASFRTKNLLKKHVCTKPNKSVDMNKNDIAKVRNNVIIQSKNEYADLGSNIVNDNSDAIILPQKICETNIMSCQPQYVTYQIQVPNSNLYSSLPNIMLNQNLYQPSLSYSTFIAPILPVNQPQLSSHVISSGSNHSLQILQTSRASEYPNNLFVLNPSNNGCES